MRSKPNALILDFFAGSGTALHATALLNAQDGGQRRCILVTDEVEDKLVRCIRQRRHHPRRRPRRNQRHLPERDLAALPQCDYWPAGRWHAAGWQYLDGRKFDDGFAKNLDYFRLDFLDPDEVARGDAFQAILPILWLMAGCQGEREDSKGSMPWFMPKHSPFAVLVQERHFRAFADKLAGAAISNGCSSSPTRRRTSPRCAGRWGSATAASGFYKSYRNYSALKKRNDARI